VEDVEEEDVDLTETVDLGVVSFLVVVDLSDVLLVVDVMVLRIVEVVVGTYRLMIDGLTMDSASTLDPDI